MGSCISTPSSSTRQSTKYVGGQYVLGGGNKPSSTPSESRGRTQVPIPARPQGRDIQKPAPTSSPSSPTTALLAPSTAPSADDEARRKAIAQAAEARQKANTNRGANASNPKRGQLPKPTPKQGEEDLVWE